MDARISNLKILSLSAIAGVMVVASGGAMAMEAQSGADAIGHGGGEVTHEGPYGKPWPANVKTLAPSADGNVTHSGSGIHGRQWPSSLKAEQADTGS